MVSGVKTIMLPCCHVGTLEHFRNRILISKREKGIVRRTFFDDRLENIILLTVNPEYFGSVQNLAQLCLVTRGNLSVVEE